ncbi:MAG: CobQ/CobB/MinD/ParA nucleotide binding domain-containing protein [Verrucomicrobiae bacterium]|nr:CobQ/CobB/MinD/ParA nucleotide binding domain-containing protein [Verrucomicrobiae bacterium]
MVKAIKVLIADSDVAERGRIKDILTRESDIQVMDVVEDGNECLSRALAQNPDIVILRSDLPGQKGMQVAERLYMDRPDIGLILLLDGNEDEDIWRQMVLAGINEYVTRPIDPQRLVAGLRKVVGIKRKFTVQSNGASNGGRKFITITSARGGCGKTFLATNLAVILARQAAKTVLADFSLTGGDAGMFLDIIPQRTLKDLFAVFGGVDADVLESMLTKHSSGLSVLSSPMNSFESLRIAKANAERAFELMRQDFELTIVDTEHPDSETTQLALKYSDIVVVVTGGDLPRLKSTKFFVRDLAGKVPADKIKVVLNRYSAAKEISDSDAQAIIESPIIAHLPHDISLVASSINRGQPVVMTHPNKAISEAVMELAAQFYTPANSPVVAAGRGGFRKFFNMVP